MDQVGAMWSDVRNIISGLTAGNSFVILRIVGVVMGLVLVAQAFFSFRHHTMRRAQFLLVSAFGLALLAVAIQPAIVNVVAQMLVLRDRQFGRIIALLILSNFALWILAFGLRGDRDRKSVQFDRLIRALAVQQFFTQWGQDHVKPIMVLIPALNEADNLSAVLPRIPKEVLGIPMAALVIDDGSDDGTAAIAANLGIPAVSNVINRGEGAALRVGYDIAMRGGARIVVTMGADGQHVPEEIERLVAPIVEDTYDFVIGSRVKGERERDSLVRWLGVHVFSSAINLLTGLRITDSSSGFRAFKIEAIEAMTLRQDQFQSAEVIIDAAKRHMRIGEAPITILRRHSGQSKKGKNLAYGANYSKVIVTTWLRD